ncbi:H-2 class I histocompatibility antigen Q9 alpha chain-like [Crotalus adamanteus]|uniref:H-2 class I histocompatibility antigen Q9 alpha chain-like n=1 Tax=Crotalus adamanteus TaxID=8729 RepID=A0AAW1BTE9_CROAD
MIPSTARGSAGYPLSLACALPPGPGNPPAFPSSPPFLPLPPRGGRPGRGFPDGTFAFLSPPVQPVAPGRLPSNNDDTGIRFFHWLILTNHPLLLWVVALLITWSASFSACDFWRADRSSRIAARMALRSLPLLVLVGVALRESCLDYSQGENPDSVLFRVRSPSGPSQKGPQSADGTLQPLPPPPQESPSGNGTRAAPPETSDSLTAQPHEGKKRVLDHGGSDPPSFCRRKALIRASSHSLKYFSTSISDPSQGQPHFVCLGYVDDELFTYYDSHSRKFQPRVSWMEKVGKEDPQYWDRYTQRARGHEETFREGLETLRLRYNQSEGLHTWQKMYGCELQADGRKGGFQQFGYDGRTFLTFDKETLTWVAPVPQAQITQRKWDAIPGWNQRWKAYLEEECIDWIKKYLSYGKETLLRTEPPVVTMSLKPEVQDGMETHICRVDGFYPREIEASWMRDGEVWLPDTLHGSVAPNADGTYHRWLSIQIDLKERGRYHCHVEHDSLPKPLDVALKEPKSSLGIIIGCVVAGLVLLGVIVGIYVFFSKSPFLGDGRKMGRFLPSLSASCWDSSLDLAQSEVGTVPSSSELGRGIPVPSLSKSLVKEQQRRISMKIFLPSQLLLLLPPFPSLPLGGSSQAVLGSGVLKERHLGQGTLKKGRRPSWWKVPLAEKLLCFPSGRKGKEMRKDPAIQGRGATRSFSSPLAGEWPPGRLNWGEREGGSGESFEVQGPVEENPPAFPSPAAPPLPQEAESPEGDFPMELSMPFLRPSPRLGLDVCLATMTTGECFFFSYWLELANHQLVLDCCIIDHRERLFLRFVASGEERGAGWGLGIAARMALRSAPLLLLVLVALALREGYFDFSLPHCSAPGGEEAGSGSRRVRSPLLLLEKSSDPFEISPEQEVDLGIPLPKSSEKPLGLWGGAGRRRPRPLPWETGKDWETILEGLGSGTVSFPGLCRSCPFLCIHRFCPNKSREGS